MTTLLIVMVIAIVLSAAVFIERIGWRCGRCQREIPWRRFLYMEWQLIKDPSMLRRDDWRLCEYCDKKEKQ